MSLKTILTRYKVYKVPFLKLESGVASPFYPQSWIKAHLIPLNPIRTTLFVSHALFFMLQKHAQTSLLHPGVYSKLARQTFRNDVAANLSAPGKMSVLANELRRNIIIFKSERKQKKTRSPVISFLKRILILIFSSICYSILLFNLISDAKSYNESCSFVSILVFTSSFLF